MLNNDTWNRKLRITFVLIFVVERGIRENYTNFYNKYRAVCTSIVTIYFSRYYSV